MTVYKYPHPVSILLCVCFFAGILQAEEMSSSDVLAQSRTLYSKIEQSQAPLSQDQQLEISKSIELLLKNKPSHPSGQYLAAIGDGYYYLGKFGEALLFWRSAELRLWQAKGLHQRIELVRSLVGMDRPRVERRYTDWIGLSFLPLGLKYALLIFFWVLSFFFWSLWQWLSFRPLHHVFLVLILLATLLTAAVSWYEWVVPPRVLVLKSTELRGSMDTIGKKGGAPYWLHVGEEAEVLSASPDKKWLRIRTGAHQTGYVSGGSVGFIE